MPKSAYDLRIAENRDEWIAQFGGTRESEAAVAAGLNWLVRHQGEGGFWNHTYLSDGHDGVCRGPPFNGGVGSAFPFAQTGLAILALQAAGHFEFNNAQYSAAVGRGLHWLTEHQADDGLLSEKGPSMYYEHGMAAFALADSCAAANGLSKSSDPTDPQRREKGDSLYRTWTA